MQENVKPSSKLLTKQVEKLICIGNKYTEAIHLDPILTQKWQKLEGIDSFRKEKSRNDWSLNDKLTVLKVKSIATSAFFKWLSWAAVASGVQSHLFFYNKNNNKVVKLNDKFPAKEIRNKPSKKLRIGLIHVSLKILSPLSNSARPVLCQMVTWQYQKKIKKSWKIEKRRWLDTGLGKQSHAITEVPKGCYT